MGNPAERRRAARACRNPHPPRAPPSHTHSFGTFTSPKRSRGSTDVCQRGVGTGQLTPYCTGVQDPYNRGVWVPQCSLPVRAEPPASQLAFGPPRLGSNRGATRGDPSPGGSRWMAGLGLCRAETTGSRQPGAVGERLLPRASSCSIAGAVACYGWAPSGSRGLHGGYLDAWARRSRGRLTRHVFV